MANGERELVTKRRSKTASQRPVAEALAAMSSLAAARADNFYYDPGWTPAAGSLNTYHGTHALGRASKLKSQGILVIRCVSPVACRER